MRPTTIPIFLFLVWASPVWAQGPSAADDLIAFESSLHEDVREGYVTLRWNSVADAVDYEVLDGQEKSAYRGVMTEAFISGLSDGTHLFHVRAFDNAGSIIATAKPTTVLVHHWPVSYAIALFTIGFAVVMGVIVVIVRGAIAPTSPAGDR